MLQYLPQPPMADLLHSATQRDTNPADSTLHPNASERRNSSRSPHPYHRRGASLLKAEIEGDGQGQGQDQFDRPSTTNQSSDSGTEADDERGRFLKGLPAPPLRPHKGLRGASFEDPTPHATPLDTPSPVENDEKQFSAKIGGKNDSWVIAGVTELHALRAKYIKRRRLELVRRIIETILFFSIGLLVTFDHLSEGTLLPYIPGETSSYFAQNRIDPS